MAELGVSGAPVSRRIKVGPTREQHAAETVEQRRDSVQLKRREHDGQPTCALDRAQIGQPKRHLDPGGLAVRAAAHLLGEAQLRGRYSDQSW
jgi:hypothetical protein